MDNVKPPVESWEMMRDLKAAVGLTEMQKIFSVGTTQINRYCRNPEFTADSERNPLDRLRIMFREANDAGASETVRAALDFLMAPLGLRIMPVENIEPDRPTTKDEQLDDWQALGIVQKLMNSDRAHPNVVRGYVDRAKEDLEQTFTSYSRDWYAKNEET
jgi:hypothetical protein